MRFVLVRHEQVELQTVGRNCCVVEMRRFDFMTLLGWVRARSWQHEGSTQAPIEIQPSFHLRQLIYIN